MPSGSNLYHSVIHITEDYLGPAAQRFVDRQLQNHIGKQNEQLNKHDLAEFIEWSRVAFGVLTDNTHLVDEYVGRLESLNN